MTEDEKFIEALREAMLAPLSYDVAPCCDLFGHTLHHHWKLQEDE